MLRKEDLTSLRGHIMSYHFDESLQSMLMFWPDIKVVSAKRPDTRGEFENIGSADNEAIAIEMFIEWANKSDIKRD